MTPLEPRLLDTQITVPVRVGYWRATARAVAPELPGPWDLGLKITKPNKKSTTNTRNKSAIMSARKGPANGLN